MLGVPENDGGKQQQRDQAAEIEPRRDQPVSQSGQRRPARSGSPARRTARCISTASRSRRRRRPPATTRRVPVCSTLASANSRKLEATSSGASGVTIMVPTAAISVMFSRIADEAATRRLPNRIGGGLIDRPAHRQRQQDRDQPHAELGIARDQRAEPDHHRDHRRMIVVAAGEMLRPHPVIGFVEGDRRECRGDQAQRRRAQGSPDPYGGQPAPRSDSFWSPSRYPSSPRKRIQYAGKPAIGSERPRRTGSPGPGYAKAAPRLRCAGSPKLPRRRQAGRRQRSVSRAHHPSLFTRTGCLLRKRHASSLAPDEQSGHRVVPHHAHQRAGKPRQPPDRFLVEHRERDADIGEQSRHRRRDRTATGRAGSQIPSAAGRDR